MDAADGQSLVDHRSSDAAVIVGCAVAKDRSGGPNALPRFPETLPCTRIRSRVHDLLANLAAILFNSSGWNPDQWSCSSTTTTGARVYPRSPTT